MLRAKMHDNISTVVILKERLILFLEKPQPYLRNALLK